MINRLPLILLLGIAVLLSAILVAEILAEPPPEAEIAGASASRLAASPPAMRPEPAAGIDQMIATILARPLFNASRRPAASADAPAANTGLDNTRLAGIVTEAGRRFAVFAPMGAKALVVKEGDTVNGWHVDSISPSEVALTGPGGTTTLQPKNDPHLMPPPPGTAPPFPSPSRASVPARGNPAIPQPPYNRGPGRAVPPRVPR
jgi:hypothetical protein